MWLSSPDSIHRPQRGNFSQDANREEDAAIIFRILADLIMYIKGPDPFFRAPAGEGT